MEKTFPPIKKDIQSRKRWLGIALVAASFIFYGCLLLVPFSSLSAERTVALSAALVILGEGSFWLAVLILGREALAKYRDFNWRKRLPAWLKKMEEKIKSMSER
ncbi:MAG: transporter suffix domain-containing protein [Methanothrix sp.]|nr:transporter suffix domain-containing protein [Methanothrix sp.]MDD4447862.1 transporter suffix domain-containing protein [Methanothrix sp.]